jgi:hypothetical protein
MIEEKTPRARIQTGVGHADFIFRHRQPPNPKEKGPKIALQPVIFSQKRRSAANRNFRLCPTLTK